MSIGSIGRKIKYKNSSKPEHGKEEKTNLKELIDSFVIEVEELKVMMKDQVEFCNNQSKLIDGQKVTINTQSNILKQQDGEIRNLKLKLSDIQSQLVSVVDKIDGLTEKIGDKKDKGWFTRQ